MSAHDTPEHQCRQGRRCKGRTRDDEGGFHGSGVERPNSLCRACEEYAFEAIRELATDYGLLVSARAEERSTVSGPKVSGSSELPIPIQLGIDTLMTEMNDEAVRWARRLPGDDPYELHPCLTVICSNLGTLVDLPPSPHTIWVPHPDGGDGFAATVLDGVDGVLRLANLHRRAHTLLGIIETTTYLHDPCPHCARKALAVSKDQERVTCKGCRIVWDSKHFALLSNVLDFERQAVKA